MYTFNTLETCVPFLASLYLGIKICPLNPTAPEEDLVHHLNMIKPRIVFCAEDCLAKMEKALENSHVNSEIIVIGETKKYIQFSELLHETGTEEKFQPKPIEDIFDTAALLISSGTSGKSKITCATHYGLNSKEIMLVCLHYSEFILLL